VTTLLPQCGVESIAEIMRPTYGRVRMMAYDRNISETGGRPTTSASTVLWSCVWKANSLPTVVAALLEDATVGWPIRANPAQPWLWCSDGEAEIRGAVLPGHNRITTPADNRLSTYGKCMITRWPNLQNNYSAEVQFFKRGKNTLLLLNETWFSLLGFRGLS
jgi:hypothetical protein